MRTTPTLIWLALFFLAGPPVWSQAGALHDAVKNSDLDTVKALTKGVDSIALGARDSEGLTPLILAAIRGELEIVKTLINAGADVNQANEGGLTPLHCAVNKNYAEMVRFLIEKEANVNAVTSKGSSCLHWAALNKHLDLCKLLIRHKAKINAKAINGFTPLHMAAYSDAADIITLLLENGADASITNNDGQTAMAVAEERNAGAAMKALENPGPSRLSRLFSRKKITSENGEPAPLPLKTPEPKKIAKPAKGQPLDADGKVTLEYYNGARYIGRPPSTTEHYEGQLSFTDGSRYTG